MKLTGRYKLPNVGSIFKSDPVKIEFDSLTNTYYVNLVYSKEISSWKINHLNKGLKCVFGKEFHLTLQNKQVTKLKILNIATNKKCLICEPLELI